MSGAEGTFEYEAAFYEAFEEEELELKHLLPSGHKYFFTWKTIQESGHKEPVAKVISTRTQSAFPPAWAGKIDGIITRSTGYDHVSAYIKDHAKGLKAAYLPDYAARAVAEQAMILWSSCLRNLKLQMDCFPRFHRDGLTGREILQKTILVAGVGRIGSEIVDIAHGLRMRVLGVDLVRNEALAKRTGMEYCSFEEGVPQADIIACALPLTELTNGLFGGKLLSKVKKGCVFVNVSRGEISPSETLLELLDKGQLYGVGLDVYDQEKGLVSVLRDGAKCESLPGKVSTSVAATLKLMNHQKAILLPHNAFNTEESVRRKSLRTAENLAEYFKTGNFLTPVAS
jgi:D-lactate dehydrogenase